MRLDDYIRSKIWEFPLLFKDETYEKSKLKVLNQIFFVGGGLELAETEDPNEGGYIVYPEYKLIDEGADEYIRVNDKPYGEVKFKELPEGYFDSVIYYISHSSKLKDVFYRKQKYSVDDVYFIYEKNVNKFQKPMILIAESKESFSPYPFSTTHSLLDRILKGEIFLQDDWMDGLISLCKRTVEYFNDIEQYKNDSYYPNERIINHSLKSFEKIKNDIKGVHNLRKNLGYEIKDNIPTKDEIKKHQTESWNKFRDDKLEFLNEFLKKFGK